MKEIRTMTAAEMKLDHINQICRLQADELETKDNQTLQIMTMFDEHEQRLEDTYNLSPDYTTKAAAYFRLDELRDLRKEIKTILGQEE